MTTFGLLATGRMTPIEREFMLAVNGDMPGYVVGVDVGASEDRTVFVLERWSRNGGERKIGDGPWEPITNLYWHGERPFVLFNDPKVSPLSCDSIQVWRGPEGCIHVWCGHCWLSTVELFCCWWAKGMYEKYFSEVR